MSYLHPEASELEFGVVKVGNNIDVLDGTISIPQSIDIFSNVTFDTVNVTTDLLLDGNTVVTNVAPAAGTGISVTGLISDGPDVSFTINNTGVIELFAGNNISVSSNVGAITISATGTGILQTNGVSTSYTALDTDEYIGITSNSVVVTLPVGVVGKTYIIKNEGAGNGPTVTGSGGQLIDGSISRALNNNASITVIFRAGAWRIV